MGLAEKRLAKEIQDKKLPTFLSKLEEISGKKINVEIDWDTFTSYDSYPLSRLDIVFSDLTSSFKKICKDDMGKEAIQESVDTIRLKNIENRDDVKIDFTDKMLLFDVQLVGDSFSAFTDSQIVKFIEERL